jgi:hypothetical protein
LPNCKRKVAPFFCSQTWWNIHCPGFEASAGTYLWSKVAIDSGTGELKCKFFFEYKLVKYRPPHKLGYFNFFSFFQIQ